MLSIVNCAGYQICSNCPPIWSKTRYCMEGYLPWVDVVLGIILYIIGGLASGGIIPAGAGIGDLLTHLGWLNIVAAIAIRYFLPMKDFCKFGISKIPRGLKPPCCRD